MNKLTLLLASLSLAFALSTPVRAEDSSDKTVTETKSEMKTDSKKDVAEDSKDDTKSDKKSAKAPAKAHAGDVTAVFKTSLGSFTVKLFKDKAPKTVENFIGLAKGTKEWTDPKTGKLVKGKSLYKGTIFHRVIPDFMIQGGDPLGTGTGGPGYQFEDEVGPLDSFNKPGILAMANAGPNTNGSQFFVTVAKTEHLNGHHTIFGEVTEGMDVVYKIAKVERNEQDRPKKDVKIESITIK